DLAALVGEPKDPGDETDGAERDPPLAEVEPFRIADDIDRLHHRVVVVQRLPHPHEHDVAKRVAGLAEGADDVVDLGDDLARMKIPGEATLPGRAEHAALRAAGLRAQAGGMAAGEAHLHRL